MNKEKYIPVSMVPFKLELDGTILTISPGVQGNIENFEFKEENDC